MTRLVAAVFAGLVAASCGGDAPKAAPGLTPEQAAKLVALENRGIGALERYDYTDALPPLREASEMAPAWVTGRYNLALALIHTGRENPAAALPILESILAEAPEHAHACFMAGWLAERMGQTSGDEATLFLKDGKQVVGVLTDIDDKAFNIQPKDARTIAVKRTDVVRVSQSALKLYARAYNLTRKDPVVGAKYGGLLARIDGREKDAQSVLEECHAKRPSLIAPVYQLMLLAGRAGDEAKVEEYKRRFEALKGRANADIDRSTVGQDIQDAYGNMGPYSMAIREFPAPNQRLAVPAAVVTAAPPADLAAWKAGALPKYAPFLGSAVFDFDQDGDLDLFVCGGEGPCGLLRNDGGMKFTDVAAQAGADVRGVYAVAAGEFDVEPSLSKDARPCRRAVVDLVLVREEAGLVFLRNQGGGQFVDSTAASGLGADLGGGRAILAIDADQEGDLDLFVSGGHGARNRLWANGGAAKFTEVTESAGLAGDFKSYGPAAALDFDDDYDLDLVVSRPEGPAVVFANDRAMKFHAVALPDALPVAPYGVIAWGDRAVLAGETGANWIRFAPRTALEARPVEGAPGGVAVTIDARGAGLADLVFADGTYLPQSGGAGTSMFGASQRLFDAAPGANLVAFDADGDGAEEVVLVRPGAAPQFVKLTAAPRGNALVADFEGVVSNGVQAGWSNLEGRGSLVEVKAGVSLAKFRLGNPSGFGCSGPIRLVTGLGSRSQADFVRIVWPDAVQQAVLDVPGGATPNCIVEEQRRPDSCPLLFSWDGTKYAFVTDFLGVGGIGFLVAPGVYGTPDPTESVKVEAALVRPRKDGRLSFRIPEAMEEVVYLDRADLQVADHPADVTVFPDERFAGEPPFPNGDLLALGAEILPVAARDETGADVTQRVLTVDRLYAGGRGLHPRLLGATAEQSVELEFGDGLAAVEPGDGLVLCLNGWIEYGYTRTSLAAAGEGFTYLPPVLEAWSDGEKAWKPLVANLGYPAGFPRVMTYDVTGKVSRATPRLRIRTNLEIYWDRVWLAPRASAAPRVTVLDPASADLRWAGYPREYSPDGRAPKIYDYQTLDPSMPWKTMSGDYTRFGDVRPLLGKADDQFVIYGKGEEIELTFDPSVLPPLPAGWTRSYVLRFDGWCKGQELYTAHGWTVEPLPFHAMSNYPYRDDERYPDDDAHRKYRADWNTRRVRPAER